MSNNDSRKIPTAFFIWVIIVVALTAGMLYISRHVKYEEKQMTIGSAYRMGAEWNIPRDVVVEKGASLQFTIGSVLLEGDTTIRVQGELIWPTETLDKVRFAPKDDSKNCRLRIEFSGDGMVSNASFEGFTGPVGEPRLELSIVAKGLLKVENTVFDGVSCSEGSSILYGEKGIEIKQCRYEGDNRKPRGARSVATTTAENPITVYALTLNRLNGFQDIFVCKSLFATNLSVSSVQAGSFTSDFLDAASFESFLISNSRFDAPISARNMLRFDRSVIQSDEDLLRIVSPTLSFTNSIIWGKFLLLECNKAVCRSSIFTSSGSRIMIGESSENAEHHIAGKGILSAAFCVFSLTTPSDALLRKYLAGTAEETEEPEDISLGRSFYRCLVISEVSVDLDFSGNWKDSLMLAQKPPKTSLNGLVWVKLDTGRIPNEIESLSYNNAVFAAIYNQASQAGILK